MKGASVLVIGSLLVASPVCAAQSILWKSVGGWSVLMDPSTGNGCYVTIAYEKGTTLRLGFDFSRGASTWLSETATGSHWSRARIT
jgi:hypothetical protein